jgi:thiamine biosynthesis lipoprotein ApbE
VGRQAGNGALATVRWQALGTNVVLQSCERSSLKLARAAARRELEAVDLACSRFRSDSGLSALNGASGRSTVVGPLLMEALVQALRAAELTDGDVDPTIGRALEIAGYDRDFKLLREPGEDSLAQLEVAVSVRIREGWREVALDRERSSVRMPAGVSLDLGATAKAWAADRAAQAACEEAGCGVLVSVGGDIATCGEPPEGGWQVRVTDDHRSDSAAPGQTITINSGGLATSSTSVRRWSHAGRTMHHIIDPYTGAPVVGRWRTVSVAAGSCTDANIASTAAIIRSGSAPEWLASLGLPARLVDRDGNVERIAGWPDAVDQARTASAA